MQETVRGDALYSNRSGISRECDEQCRKFCSYFVGMTELAYKKAGVLSRAKQNYLAAHRLQLHKAQFL